MLKNYQIKYPYLGVLTKFSLILLGHILHLFKCCLSLVALPRVYDARQYLHLTCFMPSLSLTVGKCSQTLSLGRGIIICDNTVCTNRQVVLNRDWHKFSFVAETLFNWNDVYWRGRDVTKPLRKPYYTENFFIEVFVAILLNKDDLY